MLKTGDSISFQLSIDSLKKNWDSLSSINSNYFDKFQVQRIDSVLVESSFLYPHELQAKELKMIRKENVQQFPMIDLLSILIFFFASSITYLQFKKISLFIESIFSLSKFNNLLRNENRFITTNNILFFIVSIIIHSFAVFLFDYNLKIVTNLETNYKFFIFFVSFLTIFLLKAFANSFLSFLFNIKQVSESLNYSLFIFYVGVSFSIVLPILIFAYLPRNLNFIYPNFIVVVYSVFTFLYLIRIISILFNCEGVSKPYLFLYLCTHEILPLAIFLKVIVPD
jgi:hypothetical protein